jgi:hypothetical protein
MELPWRCRTCGHENMVDFDNLLTWPVDKITWAEGFFCKKCGNKEAVFYNTTSLFVAMRKLDSISSGRADFQYHLARVLRKAEGINRRVEKKWQEPTS